MRSRLSIIISILILILASFSIGGATVAWFVSEAGTLENIFTAGTVIIDEPLIISGGGSWQPGECHTVTWSITNIGSKRAYVRARPNIEIQFWPGTTELSAWTAGYEFTNNWFGRYIAEKDEDGNYTSEPGYRIGEYTEGNPLIVDLLVGADYVYIGYFVVWDDGNSRL